MKLWNDMKCYYEMKLWNIIKTMILSIAFGVVLVAEVESILCGEN